jgi:hypothetical protein
MSPISSNNIVKIKTAIVSDSLLFLSRIATGIKTTATTINIIPILSRLSIKQFQLKTTKIQCKTLTLHPLIFGDI